MSALRDIPDSEVTLDEDRITLVNEAADECELQLKECQRMLIKGGVALDEQMEAGNAFSSALKRSRPFCVREILPHL